MAHLQGADNEAFGQEQLDTGRHQHRGKYSQHRSKQSHTTSATETASTKSCSSASSSASSVSRSSAIVGTGPRGHSRTKRVTGAPGRRESVILDSDQELLGFDSTGTPIIATHTSAARGKPPLAIVESGLAGPNQAARQQVFKAPAGATSYIVPLSGDTLMTHEQMAHKERQAALVTGARGDAIIVKPAGVVGAANLDDDKQASKEVDKKLKERLHSSESERPKEDAPASKTLIGELNERLAAAVATSAATEPKEASPEIGEKSQPVKQRTLRRQSAETGAGQQGTVANNEQHELPPIEGIAKNSGEVQEESTNEEQTTGGETSSKAESRKFNTIGRGQGAINQSESSSSALRSDETKQKQKIIQQRTISEDSTISLKSMQNRELLEKQSIFALAYSGIATDELPS